MICKSSAFGLKHVVACKWCEQPSQVSLASSATWQLKFCIWRLPRFTSHNSVRVKTATAEILSIPVFLLSLGVGFWIEAPGQQAFSTWATLKLIKDCKFGVRMVKQSKLQRRHPRVYLQKKFKKTHTTTLNLSLPWVINFKLPLKPHQKYYIKQHELDLHYSEERL